jgi:hypothetical protein
MRVLVDPETGEMVEVLPEAVIGPQEPYDYAGYRRSCFAASKEHREAITDARAKGAKAARAESTYRKNLAQQLLLAKAEHGATVAEAVAKGTDEVANAHTAMLIAQSEERTAMEKVRLCRDDADRLSSMGFWSREANSDGWRTDGS